MSEKTIGGALQTGELPYDDYFFLGRYLNLPKNPTFNTMMPNGKKLGDCTFGEVRAVNERFKAIMARFDAAFPDESGGQASK